MRELWTPAIEVIPFAGDPANAPYDPTTPHYGVLFDAALDTTAPTPQLTGTYVRTAQGKLGHMPIMSAHRNTGKTPGGRPMRSDHPDPYGGIFMIDGQEWPVSCHAFDRTARNMSEESRIQLKLWIGDATQIEPDDPEELLIARDSLIMALAGSICLAAELDPQTTRVEGQFGVHSTLMRMGNTVSQGPNFTGLGLRRLQDNLWYTPLPEPLQL